MEEQRIPRQIVVEAGGSEADTGGGDFGGFDGGGFGDF